MNNTNLVESKLPGYTYDTYVVTDNNRLAHASSLGVAKNPGEVYTPFYVFGKPGCGKTHLISATGNHIKNKKVLYFSSCFLSDAISTEIAKHNDNEEALQEFREMFLDVDVMIIDDLQEIQGKKIAQEQLLQILEELREKNVQLIIAADRAPKEWEFLKNWLRF